MPAPRTDWLGRVVGDKYRIEQRIGAGGMSTVYEAVNTWTERHVALKLLEAERGPSRARRFLREARIAARIEHPHIVDVLDMGEDHGTGALFIVQELLRGRDLRAELLQRRPSRLSPAESLELLVPIAEALEAAHLQGIVHRDVTPSNVFLARQAKRTVPKLIDFGLAGRLRRDRSGARGVSGTLAYLSPEQARGEAVDARVDVWALGVVFYRCLTGVRPWTAPDTTALSNAFARERLIPVDERADVPTELAAIVHRALDRNPERRFATMTAFVHALRDVSATFESR